MSADDPAASSVRRESFSIFVASRAPRLQRFFNFRATHEAAPHPGQHLLVLPQRCSTAPGICPLAVVSYERGVHDLNQLPGALS
jgi:hypothetical protein